MKILPAFCLLFALALPAQAQRNLAVEKPATADKRVALVIGNAAYPGAGALKNPANDARDFGAKLKRLGFEVIVRTDLKQKDMLRSLTEFGDKVQPGTEALFFYAGHGMQVRGKNYLIPVDAEIKSEGSVSSEAVDVDQLLDKLAPARLSMVILDACRNNPFERRFRGGGQGLAQINAPTGTLIAYATAPGKVAADGEGRNGLYTAELLAAMEVSGIKIEDVFKRVRANVVRKSNDAQTPWESSSLTGDFYFDPGKAGATASPQLAAPVDAGAIELSFWESIKSSTDSDDFQAYLDKYPNGQFVVLAERLIKKKLDQNAAVKPKPVKSEAATSGQEWADSDNGADINWHEAKQYCASKGSGWRLPTVTELENNYNSGQSTSCGAGMCKVASKSRLTTNWFWSNEFIGSSEAWIVALSNGARFANPLERRYNGRVLCVRQP